MFVIQIVAPGWCLLQSIFLERISVHYQLKDGSDSLGNEAATAV